MTRKPFFLIFSVLFLCAGAEEVRPAGTVTGDFLLVDVQARETALGGIYAPAYARPGASIVNPAALSGIKKSHVMFSHYQSVFNSRYEQVIYAFPAAGDNAAASFLMFSTNDELYKTDQLGYPVEKIDNYDITLGGVYARPLAKDVNFGINLKIISSKAYRETRWGISGNLGMLYRNFENRYMIGMSVENLGVSTVRAEEQTVFPVVLRAGYAAEVYRFMEEYRMMVLIEERLYLVENESAETSFGFEATYRNFFVFRYGYIFGRDEGRVGLGAGVMFESFNIDYAYQPFFLSDNVHRVTLEVVF